LTTKTTFRKVEVFSEDIAEIKTCISLSIYGTDKTRKRLVEIMQRVYDGLFLAPCTPVLLLDKDGRNMQEFK